MRRTTLTLIVLVFLLPVVFAASYDDPYEKIEFNETNTLSFLSSLNETMNFTLPTNVSYAIPARFGTGSHFGGTQYGRGAKGWNLAANQDFTFCFTLRWDGHNGGSTDRLFQLFDAGSPYITVDIRDSNAGADAGKIRMTYRDDVGGGDVTIQADNATGAFGTSQYQTGCVQRNTAQGRNLLWLDGLLAANSTTGFASGAMTLYNLTDEGGNQGFWLAVGAAAVDPFHGVFDELWMWKRALTPDEIYAYSTRDIVAANATSWDEEPTPIITDLYVNRTLLLNFTSTNNVTFTSNESFVMGIVDNDTRTVALALEASLAGTYHAALNISDGTVSDQYTLVFTVNALTPPSWDEELQNDTLNTGNFTWQQNWTAPAPAFATSNESAFTLITDNTTQTVNVSFNAIPGTYYVAFTLENANGTDITYGMFTIVSPEAPPMWDQEAGNSTLFPGAHTFTLNWTDTASFTVSNDSACDVNTYNVSQIAVVSCTFVEGFYAIEFNVSNAQGSDITTGYFTIIAPAAVDVTGCNFNEGCLLMVSNGVATGNYLVNVTPGFTIMLKAIGYIALAVFTTFALWSAFVAMVGRISDMKFKF